jgi:hypothetical protein
MKSGVAYRLGAAFAMTQLWNLFTLQNTAKVYRIDNDGTLWLRICSKMSCTVVNGNGNFKM